MIKFYRYLKTILCLLLFCPVLNCGIDLRAKGTELINKISANPEMFFLEMQQDLESCSPVAVGKRVSFETGIFPTSLPLGLMNFSSKLRLHKEGVLKSYLPQVGLFGGYWNMAWTKLASRQSSNIKSVDFSGYYYGILFTYSAAPKTRIFGGFKHSQLNSNFSLAKTQNILDARVNSFNSGFEDNFLIGGIEHLVSPEKRQIVYLNYGVKSKNLSCRISWYGKYFELGVSIYPQGIFAIHPILNAHFGF